MGSIKKLQKVKEASHPKPKHMRLKLKVSSTSIIFQSEIFKHCQKWKSCISEIIIAMVNDMTMCYSGEEAPAFVGTCHCCTDPWLRSPPPSRQTRRPPTPPSLSPWPSSHFHPSPISSGLLRPYKAVSRTNTRALTDLSLLRTAVSHLYEVSAHSEMRKEGRWRRHLLSLKNTSSILWQILQMFCNPESSHKVKILCLEIVHPFQILLQNLCNKSRSD